MSRRPRSGRWSGRAAMAGAALALLSLGALVMLFLQPWASCPGIDDSPAGCPVGQGQSLVQVGAGMVLVAGLLVAAVGAVGLARGPRDHPPA